MGPCEQPVDAARAFPITTEVDTASVRNRRRVAAVPLLDHAHPVIDVVRRGASDPTAPAPCVIDTPAQSAQTVIREIASINRRIGYADEPVLIIVTVGRTIRGRGEVAVVVVAELTIRTSECLVLVAHTECAGGAVVR